MDRAEQIAQNDEVNWKNFNLTNCKYIVETWYF